MDRLAIFRQAQATLDKNPNDAQAQFIVDLWNASSNLHSKNLLLESELAVAKHERSEALRRNGVLNARIDALESRAAGKPLPTDSVSAMIASIAAAPTLV